MSWATTMASVESKAPAHGDKSPRPLRLLFAQAVPLTNTSYRATASRLTLRPTLPPFPCAVFSASLNYPLDCPALGKALLLTGRETGVAFDPGLSDPISSATWNPPGLLFFCTPKAEVWASPSLPRPQLILLSAEPCPRGPASWLEPWQEPQLLPSLTLWTWSERGWP